eukprot:CAMPEP_0169118346 /NCGR_PEP_ID=MMETSP1015-20121227/30948_1 /TAXON_ID=342587 /ORGANISM="Karlodinium micrum, Strain CCMP2283" /LENGTH=589 /DNA_ID=CAMNT_0009181101 /DNA_START=79 /DNA_END=1848 /DNA_ORIENTATION=+
MSALLEVQEVQTIRQMRRHDFGASQGSGIVLLAGSMFVTAVVRNAWTGFADHATKITAAAPEISQTNTKDAHDQDCAQHSFSETQEHKPNEDALADSTISEQGVLGEDQAKQEKETPSQMVGSVDESEHGVEHPKAAPENVDAEAEGEPYPEIMYGASTPERILGDKMEKKMKKVVKEGGKRGVEIEGAADMGGLQFFCTNMQEPNGDVDFLYESLKAMNAKSDVNEEERKGGSGRVGKMLVSPDQENSKVALVAYCPPAKQGKLRADEWMKDMVKTLGGGEILFSDATTAKVEIHNDIDKGLFVLKLKDSAITESINYLKSKGLFPDNKDDDDSDYVFGDDDFPTVENEEIAEQEADGAQEEEAADFGDDPLAMLGGMGEEEVYKVTLMEDHVDVADGSKVKAEEELREKKVSEESAIVVSAVATQVEPVSEETNSEGKDGGRVHVTAEMQPQQSESVEALDVTLAATIPEEPTNEKNDDGSGNVIEETQSQPSELVETVVVTQAETLPEEPKSERIDDGRISTTEEMHSQSETVEKLEETQTETTPEEPKAEGMYDGRVSAPESVADAEPQVTGKQSKKKKQWRRKQ